MKKNLLLLLIPLFFMPFLLNSQNQSSHLANIDEFIIEYIEEHHKPGLAACIIKNDTVFWKGNFGYAILEDSLPVSDTTLFNAMSIGKTITAASVMKFVEDSVIGLDENINNILPFQIDNPYHDHDSITLRFLMTHSSCIIDNNWGSYVVVGDPTIELGDFLADYLSVGGAYYNVSNFSSHIQGTIASYSYSNIGSALNGYVAEVISADSFNIFATENILNPLGMDNSVWFLDELNINNLAVGYDFNGNQYTPWAHYGVPFYPGMSLRSNTQELSQFMIMMLNRGLHNNNHILEPETVDSMCTLQLNFNYSGLGLRRIGIDCITGEKIVWGHKGGGDFGYAGEIQLCRDENTAIVYLSNSSDYAPDIVERMLEYAAMIVIAEEEDSVTSNGFRANWQSAPDADSYLFDLAYDSLFNDFVPSYQNFDNGSDTSILINGLSAFTNYFYRCRAYNEYDTGAYSNSIIAYIDPTIVSKKERIDIKIWSWQNNVFIVIPQGSGKTTARIYSIDGKLMATEDLVEGKNNINIRYGCQAIITSVMGDSWSVSDKLILW
jgi:CubicO group peptidase (beta-lactamase class C family)